MGGAFDAFLAMRGLRTLPVRAKAQSDGALEIAQRLKAHPKVVRVDYPGLEDHPGHAIAKAQQDDYGPLLSLELEGGEAAARQFVSRWSFSSSPSRSGAWRACAPSPPP